MPRHYVGVALLLPTRLAQDVDAFRRGFGAPTDRVPPHITLLNGQYLSDEELDAAISHTRAVASRESNLHLVIGPVRTFAPVTPVVYLGVTGPDAERIESLRAALNADVLELPPPEHPFVPHVTLTMNATGEQISGGLASIAHYREIVTIEAITLLELDSSDDTWRPLADASFGATTAARTLGASEVTIAVTRFPTHVGSTMGRYRSLCVEAFIDGRVVGTANGRVAHGDVAWLDELVVQGEYRGTGVGGGLARAFVEAAREREAAQVRSTRGATIAGFLVRLGFEVDPVDEFVLPL